MFRTTDANGFHITFANDYTISVQWNPGNYCTDRSGKHGERRQSPTAEVAAWDKDDNWVKLSDNDDVVGWATADDVAAIMQKVSSL